MNLKFLSYIILMLAFATSVICNTEDEEFMKGGGDCTHYNDTFISKVKCDTLFNIFHKCTAKFIEVSLYSADPFTICTNNYTYTYYYYMTKFYNLMKTRLDPDHQNQTCSDDYLNKNRMTVISTITTTAFGLWNSASCEDCYNNLSTKNQDFSEHEKQFIMMHTKYSNCTNGNTKSSVCKECEQNYMDLNVLFEHQKTRNGKICFDLEDIMNKTRQEWSGVYKCCRDKRDNLTAFYSLFSSIMVITVIFYFSVYFFGSRSSDIDVMIDARQISNINESPQSRPNTSAASSGVSSASAASTASASSSSSAKRKRIEKPDKKELIINNDDDSDDDLIISKTDSNVLIKLDE